MGQGDCEIDLKFFFFFISRGLFLGLISSLGELGIAWRKVLALNYMEYWTLKGTPKVKIPVFKVILHDK